MGKRIIPQEAASEGAAILDVSACASTVADEQHVTGKRSTAEPIDLDSIEIPSPSDATDHGALQTNVRVESAPAWPFLCPFCFAAELVEPVELHSPVMRRNEEIPFVDTTFHCLACRACAQRWYALATTSEEDVDSSSRAHTLEARKGASPPNSQGDVFHVACPLCDLRLDWEKTAPATLERVLASRLDSSVVVNCCTDFEFAPLGSSAAAAAGGPSGDDPKSRCSSLSLCAVCERTRSVCVCVQCNFGLCEGCRSATHSKGGYKQHQIVSLEQARRQLHHKCRAHSGMTLDLYCRTCSTCVCVTCCFGGSHRGHDVLPLADVANRTSVVLSESAVELARLRDATAVTRKQFCSLQPLYQTKVRDVQNDIQRCFSALRSVLQDRENALLSQVNQAAAVVEKRSQLLIHNTEALEELLGSSEERLRDLPKTLSAATLMSVAEAVQGQHSKVSNFASSILSGAVTAAEGWKYRLDSGDTNGCAMAAFVLLDVGTPNEEGLLQYKRVLSDLGRLGLSTQLALSSREGRGSTPRETEEKLGEMKDECGLEDEDDIRKQEVRLPFEKPRSEDLVEIPNPSCTRTGPARSSSHHASASHLQLAEALPVQRSDSMARQAPVATSTHYLPSSTPLPIAGLRAASSRSRCTEFHAWPSRDASCDAPTTVLQPQRSTSFAPVSTPASDRILELRVGGTCRGLSADRGKLGHASSTFSSSRRDQDACREGCWASHQLSVDVFGDAATTANDMTCRSDYVARTVRGTLPFQVSTALPHRSTSREGSPDGEVRRRADADEELPWGAVKRSRDGGVLSSVAASASLQKPARARSLRRTTGLNLEL